MATITPEQRRLVEQAGECECASRTRRRIGSTSYSVPTSTTGSGTCWRWMFTGDPAGVRRDDVTDGTVDTILVVETNDLAPWTAPHDVAFSSASSLGACGSGHPGGLNAAMADGSIRFIKSTIDPGVLWSLMTRNGERSSSPSNTESGPSPLYRIKHERLFP